MGISAILGKWYVFRELVAREREWRVASGEHIRLGCGISAGLQRRRPGLSGAQGKQAPFPHPEGRHEEEGGGINPPLHRQGKTHQQGRTKGEWRDKLAATDSSDARGGTESPGFPSDPANVVAGSTKISRRPWDRTACRRIAESHRERETWAILGDRAGRWSLRPSYRRWRRCVPRGESVRPLARAGNPSRRKIPGAPVRSPRHRGEMGCELACRTRPGSACA